MRSDLPDIFNSRLGRGEIDNYLSKVNGLIKGSGNPYANLSQTRCLTSILTYKKVFRMFKCTGQDDTFTIMDHVDDPCAHAAGGARHNRLYHDKYPLNN